MYGLQLVIAILFLNFGSLLAQDSIQYRVILIGDAGETTPSQKQIIQHAARQVIKHKTSVLFLGDNVYPRGTGLKGSHEELLTNEILKSQFALFTELHTPVYFIPGNHDWDKSGPAGYNKIIALNDYINEQHDSILQVVPKWGCRDPYEISISANLVIIAVDSEWWLYPFPVTEKHETCECNNQADVMQALEKLQFKNRAKTILLATHHPLQTYGPHGGYFGWRDHLFPLRAIHKNLYIPLPVIGSLYPLLRGALPNTEDLHHPVYRKLIDDIQSVFSSHPNTILVSGHEHALELIEKGMLQVVSGSGSRTSDVTKGKHAKFGSGLPGYVVADHLLDGTSRLTFFTKSGGELKTAFSYDRKISPIQELQTAHYKSFNQDSVVVQVRAQYDSVGKMRRIFFGENYRKEWATPTKLPVIRITQVKGGLTPGKRGGGMQTSSLRLKDRDGVEWVLRSLDKNPEILLPSQLRQTFARDVLDDVMSAQHPFAPLIIPVLAHAAGVPHTNPIIGVVEPEKALGIHLKTFGSRVCLLEEREPLGNSDNSKEMLQALKADNDNGYDSKAFLRARLLDMLVSDWDRHPDQWRWVDQKKGKVKFYVGVPRDRDQALYKNEGFLPKTASREWLLPTLQGFKPGIRHPEFSLFKTNFVNPLMSSQLRYDEWMEVTQTFINAVTDSVIDAALKKLPAEAYTLRHDELYHTLVARRNNLKAAMDDFYRFINRIVDIRLTDKNESIEIKDGPANSITLVITKLSPKGKTDITLVSKTYTPNSTKEIRIYLERGNDRVIVNNSTSPIKIRIIGKGHKSYDIGASKKNVRIYADTIGIELKGNVRHAMVKVSTDSMNTFFMPTNLYNTTQPVVTAGYNLDDGFLLGGGIRHVQQGFRKKPYAAVQQLSLAHSFSTNAFRVKYRGEWLNVFKHADFTLNAITKAPNNTQNFFGRGNETENLKITRPRIKYYRTRFSVFQVDAAMRWRRASSLHVSVGPSVQYYNSGGDENEGRFIKNTSLIGSYDSLTITKDKLHGGLVFNVVNDTRNNKVFPSWGSYFNVNVIGYGGLNSYSKSFVQIIPELALYKSLNKRSTLVISERIGGGVTVGQTTFYQSLFLGGHENLLGFRQYRFAGQHMLYNNLEMRIKLADIASYIIPGQVGLTCFYDVGRVWIKDEHSNKWHQGIGGGVYFAPAQLILLQFVGAYSEEGWYPVFNMKFRY